MGNANGTAPSGANKTATSTMPTGAPAWTSGATGNNAMAPAGGPAPAPTQPMAPPAGMTAGGNTSANNALPAPNASGNWWEPGTQSYNDMNNLLATAPMGQLVNILQSGGLSGVSNAVMNNLLGSSGSNSWMNDAASLFKDLGTSGTANYQNIYNKAGTPGANEQYLTDYASGKMLNANPYVDAIVQKGQEEAATGLNQMFAGGGRYGGGVNQGTIADSFQDVSNKFRGQQYNQDVANQLTASGAISQEQLGRMGIQGTAAQGVGNMQQAGASGLGGLGTSSMQNWLTAQSGAGALGNQGVQNQLAAMGLLPTVQNNKMFDANVQQGVGQQIDAASQQQLNDLINQWTQGDMSDWARLGGLVSAGTSTAGGYGSGTSKQSQSAGWGSILGGLLSIL